MGKLSALRVNSSPALTDQVVSVKSPGGTPQDVDVSIANILALLAGAGTELSSLIQSQTNAGTAGGTLYWIDLGGMKLLWSNLSSVSYSGASASPTVALPPFFTTITCALCSGANAGGTYGQKVEFQTASPTTSAANLQITNVGSGSSSLTPNILLIGT